MERRFEFALECQNWLDLKRMYYRSHTDAESFITAENRGYIYGVVNGCDYATQRNQYERQELLYKAGVRKTKETQIENVHGGIQWFFPLPSSIAGSQSVYTDVDAIEHDKYEY